MNLNEVKEKLQSASIVDKFIYINVLVFVIALAFNSYNHLQKKTSNFIIDYFAFNANTSLEPLNWYQFISYGFVHINFIHIILNLIALYYIGNLFTSFFSKRNFIIYYLLGSVFGAIFFLIAYYYFPIFKNTSGMMIGASAGVSAILVGIATYMPNYEIKLRLIGYVKLWILAAVYVFLSVALISSGNEGGQLAHLGGAFIGFVLTKLYAINSEDTRFRIAKKSKSNLKTVYSAHNKSDDFGMSLHQKKIVKQRKIDALLDKISKSGYESLTKKEQNFLATASKND